MSFSSFTLHLEVALQAKPEDVWAHARTMEGVNAELSPWVRMTVPPYARGLTIDQAPLGRVAFRSALLAFGALPFDLHDLLLVEVGPMYFVERSSSLLHKKWGHRREIVAAGSGCLVRDLLDVELRAPLAPLVKPIVRAIFLSRLHYLARRFGIA